MSLSDAESEFLREPNEPRERPEREHDRDNPPEPRPLFDPYLLEKSRQEYIRHYKQLPPWDGGE